MMMVVVVVVVLVFGDVICSSCSYRHVVPLCSSSSILALSLFTFISFRLMKMAFKCSWWWLKVSRAEYLHSKCNR